MAKTKSYLASSRLGWSTSALTILTPALAWAGPEGAQVVAGSADIQAQGNGTVINQHTDRAVVNYQSFSVGSDEYVQFNQPGSQSVILNRVVGNEGSSILGDVNANGQVYLVNPNGVYIGEGAQLEVGALVTTTYEVDQAQFMAGQVELQNTGTGAAVVNAGQIRTANGGYVVMAADQVDNQGLIQANMGTVALTSADRVSLDVQGDGLVSYAVDGRSLASHAGVANAGEIQASRVLMQARTAGDLVSTTVNNSGMVHATGMAEVDGEIWLLGDGGHVEQTGQLQTQANGQIDVRSSHDINVTGDISSPNGTVNLIAERDLTLERGSTVSTAHQQAAQNTGGWIELSGRRHLTQGGSINAGRGGTIAYDPATITIANGAVPANGPAPDTLYEVDLETQLRAGQNTIVTATDLIEVQDLTSDGILDGRGGDGARLELHIGTPTTGGVTPDPDGDIVFANTANTIATDGGILIRAGSGSGRISAGNLISSDSITLETNAGNLSTGALTINTANTPAQNPPTISANSGLSIQTNEIQFFGQAANSAPAATLNLNAADDLSTGDIHIESLGTPGVEVALSAGSGSLAIGGNGNDLGDAISITAPGAVLVSASSFNGDVNLLGLVSIESTDNVAALAIDASNLNTASTANERIVVFGQNADTAAANSDNPAAFIVDNHAAAATINVSNTANLHGIAVLGQNDSARLEVNAGSITAHAPLNPATANGATIIVDGSRPDFDSLSSTGSSNAAAALVLNSLNGNTNVLSITQVNGRGENRQETFEHEGNVITEFTTRGTATVEIFANSAVSLDGVMASGSANSSIVIDSFSGGNITTGFVSANATPGSINSGSLIGTPIGLTDVVLGNTTTPGMVLLNGALTANGHSAYAEINSNELNSQDITVAGSQGFAWLYAPLGSGAHQVNGSVNITAERLTPAANVRGRDGSGNAAFLSLSGNNADIFVTQDISLGSTRDNVAANITGGEIQLGGITLQGRGNRVLDAQATTAQLAVSGGINAPAPTFGTGDVLISLQSDQGNVLIGSGGSANFAGSNVDIRSVGDAALSIGANNGSVLLGPVNVTANGAAGVFLGMVQNAANVHTPSTIGGSIQATDLGISTAQTQHAITVNGQNTSFNFLGLDPNVDAIAQAFQNFNATISIDNNADFTAGALVQSQSSGNHQIRLSSMGSATVSGQISSLGGQVDLQATAADFNFGAITGTATSGGVAMQLNALTGSARVSAISLDASGIHSINNVGIDLAVTGANSQPLSVLGDINLNSTGSNHAVVAQIGGSELNSSAININSHGDLSLNINSTTGVSAGAINLATLSGATTDPRQLTLNIAAINGGVSVGQTVSGDSAGNAITVNSARSAAINIQGSEIRTGGIASAAAQQSLVRLQATDDAGNGVQIIDIGKLQNISVIGTAPDMTGDSGAGPNSNLLGAHLDVFSASNISSGTLNTSASAGANLIQLNAGTTIDTGALTTSGWGLPAGTLTPANGIVVQAGGAITVTGDINMTAIDDAPRTAGAADGLDFSEIALMAGANSTDGPGTAPITVTGQINATGTGILQTLLRGADININGNIVIAAMNDTANNSIPDVTRDIARGEARLQIDGASINLADVDLTGADVNSSIQGAQLTLQAITANASGADYAFNGTFDDNGNPAAAGTAITGTGDASRAVINLVATDTALQGRATITATERAELNVTGQRFTAAQALNVTATGATISTANSSSLTGDAVIRINVAQGPVATPPSGITLADSANASGPNARIELLGPNVTTASLSVDSTGERITLGQDFLALFKELGTNIQGNSAATPNLLIDSGVYEHGQADIVLGGFQAGSNSVNVSGPITVAGHGEAKLLAQALNINLQDSIQVSASNNNIVGSGMGTVTDPNGGDSLTFTNQINNQTNRAEVDLLAGNAVGQNINVAGAISVTGGTTLISAEAYDIALASVQTSATGGAVSEAYTFSDGRTTQLSGDTNFAGISAQANNQLTLNGNVQASANGMVGTRLQAASTNISQGISLNSAGNTSLTSKGADDSLAQTETIGDVLLELINPNGSALDIAGLDVTASNNITINGLLNSSGEVRLNAGAAIHQTVAVGSRYLPDAGTERSAIRDPFRFNDPLLGPTIAAAELQAVGLQLQAATINLPGATLMATGSGLTDTQGDNAALTAAGLSERNPALLLQANQSTLGSVDGNDYLLLEGGLNFSGNSGGSNPTAIQVRSGNQVLSVNGDNTQTANADVDLSRLSAQNIILGSDAQTGAVLLGGTAAAATLGGNTTLVTDALNINNSVFNRDNLDLNFSSVIIGQGLTLNGNNSATLNLQTGSLDLANNANIVVNSVDGDAVININATTANGQGLIQATSVSNGSGSIHANITGNANLGMLQADLVTINTGSDAAAFVTNTGQLRFDNGADVVINNGAFSGLATLTSSSTQTDHRLVLATGGALSFNYNFNGRELDVASTGNLDISNQTVTANERLFLNAGADLLISGATLNANAITLLASADINNMPGATVTGNGVALQAGGNIALADSSINVGAGMVAGFVGDTGQADILGDNAPNSVAPNGSFIAGSGINIGTLNSTGDHLYFSAASQPVLNSVTSPENVVVQFQPINSSATIGIESSPHMLRDVNLDADFFQVFTGTTVFVGGSDHNGDIFVGENGTPDFRSQNLAAFTTGDINQFNDVLTTGTGTNVVLVGASTNNPTNDDLISNDAETSSVNSELSTTATDDAAAPETGSNSDTRDDDRKRKRSLRDDRYAFRSEDPLIQVSSTSPVAEKAEQCEF